MTDPSLISVFIAAAEAHPNNAHAEGLLASATQAQQALELALFSALCARREAPIHGPDSGHAYLLASKAMTTAQRVLDLIKEEG